ncbi:MAG: hypothetical protein ACTS6J_10665 [Burkholderiales bacterium]
MKMEKNPSNRILKTPPTAPKQFQTDRTSASPRDGKAGTPDNRPARLYREEHHLSLEPAPRRRAERPGPSDDIPEQDWLEAEIGIELELERMRRRNSQLSD